MSNGKVKVIIKEPGREPVKVSINNTVEEMQIICRGFVQPITISPIKISQNIVMLVNGDGRVYGLQKNFPYKGVDVVGTVIFAGVSGSEFSDVPLTEDDVRMMINRWVHENG